MWVICTEVVIIHLMSSLALFFLSLLAILGVAFNEISSIFSAIDTVYPSAERGMNFFVTYGDMIFTSGSRGFGVATFDMGDVVGRVVSVQEVVLALVLTVVFVLKLATKTEAVLSEADSGDA